MFWRDGRGVRLYVLVYNTACERLRLDHRSTKLARRAGEEEGEEEKEEEEEEEEEEEGEEFLDGDPRGGVAATANLSPSDQSLGGAGASALSAPENETGS